MYVRLEPSREGPTQLQILCAFSMYFCNLESSLGTGYSTIALQNSRLGRAERLFVFGWSNGKGTLRCVEWCQSHIVKIAGNNGSAATETVMC